MSMLPVQSEEEEEECGKQDDCLHPPNNLARALNQQIFIYK